jgi:hypothetical protein
MRLEYGGISKLKEKGGASVSRKVSCSRSLKEIDHSPGIVMRTGVYDKDEKSHMFCEVENFRKVTLFNLNLTRFTLKRLSGWNIKQAHSLTFFEVQELLVSRAKSRVRMDLKRQVLEQVSECIHTVADALQLITNISEKITRKKH